MVLLPASSPFLPPPVLVITTQVSQSVVKLKTGDMDTVSAGSWGKESAYRQYFVCIEDLVKGAFEGMGCYLLC